MTRRGFIQALGLAAAAVTFGVAGDPETPLAVGDLFTVAGYYALDPVTCRPSTHLQCFVVTRVVAGGFQFQPNGRAKFTGGR